jgi:hypothetical protein
MLVQIGYFFTIFANKKTKFSSSGAKFWAIITYIDIASYHNSIIMHNMAIGCSWLIPCTIKNSSFTIQVRWWVARWWTSCRLFEKKTFLMLRQRVNCHTRQILATLITSQPLVNSIFSEHLAIHFGNRAMCIHAFICESY